MNAPLLAAKPQCSDPHCEKDATFLTNDSCKWSLRSTKIDIEEDSVTRSTDEHSQRGKQMGKSGWRRRRRRQRPRYFWRKGMKRIEDKK
jgi:hypothetical protein